MDFDGEHLYEEFFSKMQSAGGPRNLRQIFEDDDKPLQSETTNLRYQPQQQEKHKAKAQCKLTEPVESWNTVIAKVATGYNGSKNMGRVGIALSRNGVGAAKLVVYKSKKNLLSTLLLTRSVTSAVPKEGTFNVILRESYMQFYDDDQHFWSLRFEKATDEKDFTEELYNLGLKLEKMGDEETKGTIPPMLSQPKPLPRQKPKPTEDSYDSETESTQSTEDITTTKIALVTAGTTSPQKVSQTPKQIAVLLDEQRAKQIEMERNMETLMQAMNRASIKVQDDTKKLESITQGKVYELNNTINTAIQASSDNEDELLELEQKFLDSKKQNRMLVKSLKAKEQELEKLRASTCAVGEELLTQNKDLKKQNAALVTAITAHGNCDNIPATTLSLSLDCANCDKYLNRIKVLEKRTLILQEALLNYPNIASSSLTSVKTSSQL